MFQRSDDEKDKDYWENAFAYYFGWESDFKVRVLNSIIFAQKENKVISILSDLLLYFGRHRIQCRIISFSDSFHELITKYCPSENCPIVNDCIPHIIQTKINGNYDRISFGEAMKLTSMHKMAYFDDAAVTRLKLILKLNRNV